MTGLQELSCVFVCGSWIPDVFRLPPYGAGGAEQRVRDRTGRASEAAMEQERMWVSRDSVGVGWTRSDFAGPRMKGSSSGWSCERREASAALGAVQIREAQFSARALGSTKQVRHGSGPLLRKVY